MSIASLSRRWAVAGLFALAGCFIATAARAQSVSPPDRPSDAEIAKILAERIDAQRQSVGIVVGVLEPAGRRVISHGSATKGEARRLDGDTVFEIGSITKVFTALLLADAVERGDVALSDPVAKFLPTTVRVPERGRAITVGDLASHMSGLPRLPSNMKPNDLNNPYADYTVEQLYAFLSTHQLTRDVGAQYEYSNLGGGLLGHVLALRAGTSYEALVENRITRPLGMTSTAITLSPSMRARLASGYSSTLQPAANWDLPTLAGAGALRSTVNDLLLFVSAAVGERPTPLDKAFARMLALRHPTPAPGLQIALGWHVFTTNDHDVVWHDGGTGGYRSFVGFDPKARTAVVALSNAGTLAGVNDIGRHLLDRQVPLLRADSPLVTPQKERTAITVAPEVLDAYVGSGPRPTRRADRRRARDAKGNRAVSQRTGRIRGSVPPDTAGRDRRHSPGGAALRAADRAARGGGLCLESARLLLQGGRRAADVRSWSRRQGNCRRAPSIRAEPDRPSHSLTPQATPC